MSKPMQPALKPLFAAPAAPSTPLSAARTQTAKSPGPVCAPSSWCRAFHPFLGFCLVGGRSV